MNGKGDKDRVKDTKKFRHNYDEINWGKDHKKCKYLDEIDGCPKCGADTIDNCGDNIYEKNT